MEEKFSLKEFLRYRKKDVKKWIAMVFAAGVLLMLAGSMDFTERKTDRAEDENSVNVYGYEDETEKKLEEILTKVEGAGKVKVMITYSQSSEKVAAQEVKKEESSDGEENKTSYESTYVLKNSSDGGNEEVVLTEYMPCTLGVLIVAQGGDDIYVKEALSSAVQALLDVPAHKVEVLKMEG